MGYNCDELGNCQAKVGALEGRELNFFDVLVIFNMNFLVNYIHCHPIRKSSDYLHTFFQSFMPIQVSSASFV